MRPCSARGVELIDVPLSELRIDPIAGHKVLIAEDRAGRPNDFESAEAILPAGEFSCPFCAGHEQETPSALQVFPDDRGGWRVRVIPNKFPAVSKADPEVSKKTRVQLFSSQPAYGAHEVIIESPRHFRDITELSLDEFTEVLFVCRDRLRYWSCDTKMRYAAWFKNVGFAAGASLEHAHSQLVALPFVPEVVANEMQVSRQFYDQKGDCIFCRLLQEEIKQGERIVTEEGPFVAFCAYAGRQPFETWILPKQHAPHFEQLADEKIPPLASLLQQAVSCLQTQINPLSYNLILHTTPFGKKEARFYHWHLELIPRTAQLAGFEWGTGLYINSLSPERAATLLRDSKI